MSSSSKLATFLGSRPSSSASPTPLRPNLSVKRESETSALSSFTYVSDLEKPGANLEQPSISDSSPRVSTLARRIHGWSWQAVRSARAVASRASVISFIFLLIVPHRHGHRCCLCYSVGTERSPWNSHERRDRLFLHKPLALYSQCIDSPAPSVLCDLQFLWESSQSKFTYTIVYPQQFKRLINDPVKGVFVPLIVRADFRPCTSHA